MKNLVCMIVLVMTAILMTGCCQSLDKYEDVFDRYYTTTLKVSTSADVLAQIQNTDDELLSQSESVVAAWGKEEHKDRTHWFNMVTFDENAMTAVRKYGFILEETNPGSWNRAPKPALRFDAELVLDENILNTAYANNNEKNIAIIRYVLEQFHGDAEELTFDSRTLRSSTIMVEQALKRVLNDLMLSPANAAYLARMEGVPFDHSTLGESRIRMLIEEDTVKLKIKCGKRWWKRCLFGETPFEEHPDVQHM